MVEKNDSALVEETLALAKLVQHPDIKPIRDRLEELHKKISSESTTLPVEQLIKPKPKYEGELKKQYDAIKKQAEALFQNSKEEAIQWLAEQIVKKLAEPDLVPARLYKEVANHELSIGKAVTQAVSELSWKD